MKLKNILDKKLLFEKFDKEIECETIEYKYDSKNFSPLTELSKKDPDALFSSAMAVWNRIVSNDYYPVDPMAIARYADSHDPQVYRKISQIIGENIIKAFYYTHCQINDESLEENTVCDFAIFETYPNSLHLADISFSNPYKPIPEEKRKFKYQKFKGLGLLNPLMANMKEYAKQNSFDFITLTSASKDQIKLFEKYGFTLEKNEFTEKALNIGYSIPMELKIN